MRSCVRYYDQLGNYLGKRIHNGATKSILTREHLLMRSLNGKTQFLFTVITILMTVILQDRFWWLLGGLIFLVRAGDATVTDPAG